MEPIISILRYPDELRAVTIKPAYEIPEGAYGPTTVDLDDFYKVEERPLDPGEVGMPNNVRRLARSWEALAEVRKPDAETLYHILITLIESEPVYLGPRPRAALPDLEFSPPEFTPTEANPREYTGKRSRPPKMGGFPKTDLRPFLRDENQTKIILRKLYSKIDAAFILLEKEGIDISGFLQEITDRGLVSDPYYSFHFGLSANVKNCKLPTKFMQYILPSLKRPGWRRAIDFLGVYWRLSLNRNKSLLLAISRLIRVDPGKNTVKWCNLIELLPRSRAAIFTTLLIERRGYALEADSISPDEFIEFNGIVPKRRFEMRVIELFEALKRDISLEYLFAGFRLAERCWHGKEIYFNLNHGADFPYKTVEKIVNRISFAPDYYGRMALVIWTRCGAFEGFSEIIKRVNWKELSPETALNYLRCYTSCYDSDMSARQRKEKWSFIHGEFDKIDSTLRKINKEYRNKFVCDLYNHFLWWDSSSDLKKYMPSAYKILRRMARPPFMKKSNTSLIISDFIDETPESLTDVFLEAPDSSFLQLEKVCKSKNRETLIRKGVLSMLEMFAEFTVQSFHDFPGKLLKAAKLAGALPAPVRRTILLEFKKCKIVEKDILSLDIKETHQLLKKRLGPGVSNPFPKKLQKYLRNTLELSHERIERYTRKMWKNLTLTRLEVLEQLFFSALKADYPVEPSRLPTIGHALQLMYKMDDNKRSFKRFLKAHLGGDRTYLQTHPATRAWMKKHEKIDFDVWIEGIRLPENREGRGKVSIRVEKDPLEALKLGTHVGSCLGLGGIMSFSAAAVVLDVNKQVLYARDMNNRVIARQLIALGEEENLVCFEVYPTNSGVEIKKMFAEYDRLFARELGVELFQNVNDEYTIEHILSQDWYDDCAWDGGASLGV